MSGILGYPLQGKEIPLKVNERTFKQVLFEHIKENDVQFCCTANTLHEVFKKSFSQNFSRGLTNDQLGVWMESRNGALVLSRLEYVIWPFDLFDDIQGVETYILTIFDDHGRAVYHRNFKPEHRFTKTYILTYGE